MDEKQFFNLILIASFITAGGTFIALFFVDAPYGRHTRRGWGASIPNWVGWLAMEAPSPLVMLLMYLLGDAPKTLATLTFLLMWLAHYVHRAFIYPFEKRNRQKPMPALVMSLAIVFNLGNAYANGRYLFHFSAGKYPAGWLLDARFIAGAILFAAGYILNRWADRKLRGLRQPGETDYKIPYGGLYRYVSCPNYLGEIIEWTGWALATWSLPGLAFAAWTFANLAPRARAHHRWYRSHFPDYPPQRKALIPGVW
jgi:protein-S-isoprenylcysteine O-methyltransferase Ste14